MRSGEADLPLAGRRVLVLRAQDQAEALSSRIRLAGGEPVEAPAITIDAGDRSALRAAVRDVASGTFDLLCLTSPNGVDAVASALAEEGLGPQIFARVEVVACVGAGTAARALDRLAVTADVVPSTSTGEALGETLPVVSAGRALLPRAEIANPALPRVLRAKGYACTEVVAYRTGRPQALAPEVVVALGAGEIDLIAFSSPSTVRNFLLLIGDRPWSAAAVSIGPVTTAACRESGIEVVAEADPHDLDGLTAALAGTV